MSRPTPSPPAVLVVLAGTGTSIGKTHFAEALLLAWRETHVAVGWKPIESGVDPSQPSDQDRLAAASTFPITRARFAFAAPVSPHLAARRAGSAIDLAAVARAVTELRRTAQALVVELAGGLFSPLSDGLCNADLAKALGPDHLLIVAPDRLGVLHDVSAAIRAASTVPLGVHGVVLTAPPEADSSTGTNAGELTRVLGVPVLASLPRAPPLEMAHGAPLRSLLARLCRADFAQSF